MTTSSRAVDPFAAEMRRLLDSDCDSLYVDRVYINQSWNVRLTCRHSTFTGKSHGPLDLWRAMDGALDTAEEWHDDFYKKEASDGK